MNAFEPNLKFSDLNEQLITDFREFLLYQKNLKGGATKKYFGCFQKITRHAKSNPSINYTNDSFEPVNLRVKVEKPIRSYLELEEIKSLKDLDLDGDYLEQFRDQFLFQIYTGLYHEDLKRLKKSELKRNELGYYILSKRKKNDNPYIIPLYKFPYAEEIIGKYWNDEYQEVFSNTIYRYNDHKYQKNS